MPFQNWHTQGFAFQFSALSSLWLFNYLFLLAWDSLWWFIWAQQIVQRPSERYKPLSDWQERDIYQNVLSHTKVDNTWPMTHFYSVRLEVHILNSKSLLHSLPLCNRFSRKTLSFCLWSLQWASGPVQNNCCCTTCPGIWKIMSIEKCYLGYH